MLVPFEPVTLVTVVHPICGAFIERFPPMLKALTLRPQVVEHWVLVNPGDGMTSAEIHAFNDRVQAAFELLPWTVNLVRSAYNRWDLPGYNDLADAIRTPWWVGISPDARLFGDHWIEEFFQGLDANREIGMAGPPGPSRAITPQTALTDSDWGWIGKLLLDRGIPFDHCEHVQTWCFLMNHAAFRAVGGFWESESHRVEGKGDVIAAEVSMGARMRAAGYDLSFFTPHLYHYGTGGGSATLEQIDATDRARNFPDY